MSNTVASLTRSTDANSVDSVASVANVTSAHLIVIGAGLAGWTTVREFRKRDSTSSVLLISQDSADFYAKPSLSNALTQKRLPDQLVTTQAAALAKSLNVTVLAHTRVLRIDPKSRCVEVQGLASVVQGDLQPAEPPRRIAYEKLVLATGAQPIRVPLSGDAVDQVHSINHLDDYRRFQAALQSHAERLQRMPRVLIMGAGLIGTEFANDLAASGHPVHVVDPSERPLAALLPVTVAEHMASALQAIGVVWHFGTTVQSVCSATRAPNLLGQEPDANARPQTSPMPHAPQVPLEAHPMPALRVTLADSQVIEADLVLSAVGLRPNLALAQDAGLQCERGIVVDAKLQTTAPDLYALGDCAQYASAGGRTLPYVLPIMQAAKVLADNLSGKPTALQFPVMPVAVKTPAYPVVVSPPTPGLSGQWQPEQQASSANATNSASAESVGTPLTNATTAQALMHGQAWRFLDDAAHTRGFVLTGSQTSRRQELAAAVA